MARDFQLFTPEKDLGPGQTLTNANTSFSLDSQPSQKIKQCVLIVGGMTCSVCTNTIESHMVTVEGVLTCSVSLLTHKATLTYDERYTGIRTLIEEIECLGFDCRYQSPGTKEDIRDIINKEVAQYRHKFFTSFSLLLPIWVLMWVVPYLYPRLLLSNRLINDIPAFVFLVGGFSTCIQIFIGYQFYANAYKNLRNRSANMDVLVVLGTTAAWTYATAMLFVGYSDYIKMEDHMYRMAVQEHAHNYEISSVLITVILLGKLLESISKQKTIEKLSQLSSMRANTANLLKINQTDQVNLNSPTEEIAVELLQINDLIKVTAGTVLPIDGRIVYGKGQLNESLLTGESQLVNKDISQQVFGGSTLVQGNLIVKVKQTAENSSINKIIELVEKAQSTKAPIQNIADMVSKFFVPLIISLSLLTWIGWFCFAYSHKGMECLELHGQTRFQFAFSFGISTLVIACPCALGLATPTAVMVGTGIAASHGILVKGGDILEKINHITTVIFDKTGTLTSGELQVQNIVSLKSRDVDGLRLVYAAEQQSDHPIAKTITSKIKNLFSQEEIEAIQYSYQVLDFQNIEGEGITAKIQHQDQLYSVLCGNSKLVRKLPSQHAHSEEVLKLEESGCTVVQICIDGELEYLIPLKETHVTKDNCDQVIQYLREKLNLKIKMITGDNKHAAYQVAQHLNIDMQDVVYEAYPVDKKRAVEQLQARGEKVMFVGDGINDGPVLAQADVGVTINAAADITIQAASVVLMKDNLFDVVNAIRISKLVLRRIKINLVWAFVYNLMLIPIAMGCLYPFNEVKFDPMLAGFAMAMSSISVVLSSLLLRRFRPVNEYSNLQLRGNQKEVYNEMTETDFESQQ